MTTTAGDTVTVYAIWQLEEYDITYTAPADAKYTITAQKNDADFTQGTANITDTIVFTITPSAGYSINEVSAGESCTLTVSGNEYTLTNVSADITLNVVTQANTNTKYTVEFYFENDEWVDEATKYATDAANNQILEGTTDTETTISAQTQIVIDKCAANYSVVEIKQTNINGDESGVVEVYLDINRYTIQFTVIDADLSKLNANFEWTDTLTLKHSSDYTLPALETTHYTYAWYLNETEQDGSATFQATANAEYIAVFTAKAYDIAIFSSNNSNGKIQMHTKAFWKMHTFDFRS